MDKKIKDIKIEIGGDTTALSKALKDINKPASDLQAELKKINGLLKDNPENKDIKSQQYVVLKEAVEKATVKLQALKKAQEEVDKLYDGGKGTLSAEAYRDFQREVAGAENQLKKAESALNDYDKTTKTTEKDTGKLKDAFSAVGKVAGTVGKAIAEAAKVMAAAIGTVAAGVTAVVKKSIDAGIEFETAFTGVTKTVDGTDEQLSRLKDSIRNMAMEMPSTTTEISAVAEAAGQLGIKVDDISEFTRVMIDLGQSTNLSSTEAASALAKLVNITGMSSDDYGKLGSAIVDLGNNFATTEADIVAMTTRLASTGAVVGLSEPQMLAVATALSSVGIEAEAGGSAISKLMKQMETSVATYGKATKAISSTGKSLRELELMSANDSKSFKGLADSVGLTSTELNNYIKQAKGLEAFADVANMTADEFIQAWGTDAVAAMDSFITGLNDTDRLGQGAIETLDEMGLKEVRLSNAILALSSSNGILTESLNVANAAWEEGTALTEEAGKRYATVESQLQMMKNGVNDLGLSIYEGLEAPLKDVLSKASGYIKELSEAIREGGFDGLVDKAGEILGNVLTEITNAMPKVIETAVSILSKIGETVRDNLPMITEAAATVLMQFIDTMVDGLPEVIKMAVEIIGTLANGLVDKLPEIIDAALDILMTLVNTLVENLPEIIAVALDIIIALVNGISEALPELIPACVDAILTIVDGLLDNLPEIIDCALQLILGLADGLIAALPMLIDRAPEIIAELVAALINSYPKLVKAGWELIGKLAGGIIEALPKIATLAGDIGKKLADTLINMDWLQLGKDILDGIISGITNTLNSIKKAGESIINGFKKVLGIASPSKVAADIIGKNLALGIGVGFEDTMKDVSKKMGNIIPTELNADVNSVMYGVQRNRSKSFEQTLEIPISIGGSKFTKIVARMQYDESFGRMRVKGVSTE